MFAGAAFEFINTAELSGAVFLREQVEMISVSSQISVSDHATLAAGFALSLGIEQSVGKFG